VRQVFSEVPGLLTRVKAATLVRLAANKPVALKPQDSRMLKITPDPPNPTLEDSLAQISGLLRCAKATAYESADTQSGSNRDLAFSVVHLIDMARVIVDRSLDQVEIR
jgi:hypothetical protein